MTTRRYDDLPANRSRALSAIGHGPVLLTQTVLGEPPLHRAWCVSCLDWVGPDRSDDPPPLHMLEDDACAHYHRAGFPCGVCFWCTEAPKCAVCGRPRAVDWGAWADRNRFNCGHCDQEGPA